MLSSAVRYTISLLITIIVTLSLQSRTFAAPVLLFDQGHNQRFVIEKDGPLHLSSFAAVMQEEGFAVKASTGRFTEEALSSVEVLVISGPFAPLDKAETDTVLGFVSRGGRLAVMLHIPSPVADLVQGLEVDFTNRVLFEKENIIGKDPRNFQVKSFLPHPLFASLPHFSFYGGWGLMNTGSNSRIIASTSQKSWVDLEGDEKPGEGDGVQSFGVVVAGTRGAGRFVLFGDDAIFQNKFLDEQNRRLGHNLAVWLKQ